MPITYLIPERLKGKTIHTRPCEWNESGVYVLDDKLTPKDLRYLAEVIGIQLEKHERQIISKEDVQTEANIQDNNKG